MASDKSSTGLRLIEEIEDAPATGQPDPSGGLNDVAMALLLTALKALGQRTLVAMAALQTILAIGSVLALAWRVLTPTATPEQLIGLGIYAAFVLAALWTAKRH